MLRGSAFWRRHWRAGSDPRRPRSRPSAWAIRRRYERWWPARGSVRCACAEVKMSRFRSAEHMVRSVVGGAPTMLGALAEQGEGALDAIVAEVAAATRDCVDDDGWAASQTTHVITGRS